MGSNLVCPVSLLPGGARELRDGPAEAGGVPRGEAEVQRVEHHTPHQRLMNTYNYIILGWRRHFILVANSSAQHTTSG